MEIDLLLKIGGSCFSDKKLLFKALKTKSPDDIKAALSINSQIIERIVSEIAAIYKHFKRIIILTGVGTPGHLTVLRHNLHKGDDKSFEQHLGLLEAQIEVNRLRQMILEAFFKHNIPAVQFYASSIYESDERRIIRGTTQNIQRFISLGMVPVLSGDMVPDITMGYSVLSGDQILVDLAKQFKPKTIIFGSDVNGVYDSDPKLNPDAQLIHDISSSEINDFIKKFSGADASGQIKGKLNEINQLLHLGFTNIYIINLTEEGNLRRVLSEEKGNFTKFY